MGGTVKVVELALATRVVSSNVVIGKGNGGNAIGNRDRAAFEGDEGREGAAAAGQFDGGSKGDRLAALGAGNVDLIAGGCGGYSWPGRLGAEFVPLDLAPNFLPLASPRILGANALAISK